MGRFEAPPRHDRADLLRCRGNRAWPHFLRSHVPSRRAFGVASHGGPVSGGPDNRLADQRPLSGRFYLRIGFRATALIGITVTVIGSAALAITAYTPNIVLV